MFIWNKRSVYVLIRPSWKFHSMFRLRCSDLIRYVAPPHSSGTMVIGSSIYFLRVTFMHPAQQRAVPAQMEIMIGPD